MGVYSLCIETKIPIKTSWIRKKYHSTRTKPKTISRVIERSYYPGVFHCAGEQHFVVSRKWTLLHTHGNWSLVREFEISEKILVLTPYEVKDGILHRTVVVILPVNERQYFLILENNGE